MYLMGLNPFKNSSDNKGKWTNDSLGLIEVESALRSAVSFMEMQEVDNFRSFSGSEKQAIKDIKGGKKAVKLSRSEQRALIQKAKKEEARFKALAKNKKK
jgi:hypothetical protein